jgi:hypothetical protein
MMIALVILFALGSIVTLFIIVGMTLYDIAEIRAKRLINKHPYSRKLRGRPIVHVVVNDVASDELLQSIRKNRYKKLAVTAGDSLPTDASVLTIDGSTALEPNSVIDAVHQMAVSGSQKTITITPIITLKYSVTSVFHTYHQLSRLPFASAKAGFGIASHSSLHRGIHRNQLYHIGAQLCKVINLILFMYACYSAANLNQPELLLIYLWAMSFWLAWSIIRYPYFSFIRKVGLLALSPVSFIYFVYLTIAAPFGPVSLHVNRRNAIIKA